MTLELRRLTGRYALTVVVGLFAAAALVEDLTSPTVTINARIYDRGDETVIVGVLVAIVGLVALRRRWGIAAALGAIGLLGVAAFPARAWVLESSFMFVLAMAVCGICGYLAVRRIDSLGLLVLWTVGTVTALRYPAATAGKWFSVVLFMGIAWATGHLLRLPIGQARSAEERAKQLEEEQVVAAQRAVVIERQRIARELHDVIAHAVTVMTVQAGAVRRRLTTEQARERDALVSVEQTGRDALAEMRRLVGLLKDDDEVPDYAPQPGMATLATLIGTVREAGLPVEVSVEGEARTLSPGVDLTAYRVVQEALTNVLNHARSAHAWVHVRWRDDELELEVANDGGDRNGGPSGGHGHVGMRERVGLYGGRLEGGPRAEGGYVVRAFLPIGNGS